MALKTSWATFSADATNSAYRANRYNIVPSLIFFGQMYSTSCGSVIRVSYAKSAVSSDSLLTELFGQVTDSPKAAISAYFWAKLVRKMSRRIPIGPAEVTAYASEACWTVANSPWDDMTMGQFRKTKWRVDWNSQGDWFGEENWMASGRSYMACRSSQTPDSEHHQPRWRRTAIAMPQYCLMSHGHDMASEKMWHGTERFLMLMVHHTRPYKMWHLDYPLLAIPMNVCTRTSGGQWCFEPGDACAAPSRCSQNLRYSCTTMLIYQKHDPHRIDEVFGQLL